MSINEIDRIRAVYARYARLEPRRDKYRSSPGYTMCLTERDAHIRRLLGELAPNLARCRVLDAGCGYGSLLNLFHEQGAAADKLFGIDLLPNRIRAARQHYPSITFQEGNAEELDFPDKWFDLVTAFTVFSSILDDRMAANVALEITRVLNPGGAIIWYDMRYPNPWNRNVRPMTKARIRELFPTFKLDLQSLTLLPPVAGRLGSGSNTTYPLLARVPFLRSHYMGLLRFKLSRIGGAPG